MLIDKLVFSFLNNEIPELSGKVHPQIAPEKATLPYLVYNKVSDSEERLLSGEYEGIGQAEFDLSVWAKDYFSVQTLAQQIVTAFKALSGEYAGIEIELIKIDERDADIELETEAYLSPIALTVFYQK